VSKTQAPKTTAPVATATAAVAEAASRPAAKTAKSASTKPPTKAQAKAAASEGTGSPSVALLEPSPPPTANSRFADRFAPPKPPTRQMNSPVIESPLNTNRNAKADPKLANAWKTKSGAELSDAEVLAMPEEEYMGAKQIEFFRAKLTALKDGVLSNAGETTEHLREDTSIVPDPADRATIEEEHALELRTRDRERKLLKKIIQSLARLDTGEYGYCDETGEPIGLGRLIARPTASLSLEAQQRREMKQKMFGD